MEYLEQTLKIQVNYQDWKDQSKLPYMITDRYSFRVAVLGTYKTLFVYVRNNAEQLAVLKKHLLQIKKAAELPVTLILNSIDARRRQQLIDSDIPFVVPNQQIYLPFLGVALQDRYIRDYSAKDGLMPSSELLLLHFIYNKCKPLPMNEATHALGFSAMTITRAVRQLESLNLVGTYKEGVNKIISTTMHGKELFEAAGEYLSSPVKKTVYIDNDIPDTDLLLSGYSALSEYSLLNPPQVKTLATARIPEAASGISKSLLDSDKQMRIEIWNYDPLILADNNKVDLLSLALSLKDDPDERVQEALDEALKEFWEEYDG